MITDSIVKKIKVLSRLVYDIDRNLPDPQSLPVDNHLEKSVEFSSSIEENDDEKFYDKIDLQNSVTKRGSCVVYRDKDVKNCKVQDISDESSFDGFFSYFSCYHIMPSSARIIILDINLKIEAAYQSLIHNNARAAPIWDDEINQFVAMFTVTDFIRFLHKYQDDELLEKLSTMTIKEFRDYLVSSDFSNRLISITVESNLKEAVSMILKHNIHRLPVIDAETGNVLSILTNSQLFRFFYSKMKSFRMEWPHFMTESPLVLGLGNSTEYLSVVNLNISIKEVLDIFCHSSVACLPVVDENNKFVDIFARFDVINLIKNCNYKNLNITVEEALKMRIKILKPSTCKTTDSFHKILEIIYQTQAHRIFILDNDNFIFGVISLSDILGFLCKI